MGRVLQTVFSLFRNIFIENTSTHKVARKYVKVTSPKY